MTPSMTGQWFGKSFGSSEAPTVIIVNIEPRTPSSAVLIGVDPVYCLRTVQQGSLTLDGLTLSGKTWDSQVFDPDADLFVPLATYYRKHGAPKAPPKEANYSARFDGAKLNGEFENDIGEKGHFELWQSFSQATFGRPSQPPEVKQQLTWEEFKRTASKFRDSGEMLFRGQACSQMPLKTSFHRAGRNNLYRYLVEDVSRLRHQINAISNYCYRDFGEDVVGLLSLAQHHGFPTPLLDWTESPYVAAFFAFDCHRIDKPGWRRLKASDQSPVRVFAFDCGHWRTIEKERVRSVKDPWPDLQFLQPPAHNNPRYYPQQSVAAFSNLEDIESFVAAFELAHTQTYLTRIDIRADQRDEAEDDLRFMGITAATLFPGVEGVCSSLRARLFF